MARHPGAATFGRVDVPRGALPPDVHITVFTTTPDQFVVDGEAPSAPLAVDFAERLRADSELAAFKIENPQPTVLPNEHAQFHIEGKL